MQQVETSCRIKVDIKYGVTDFTLLFEFIEKLNLAHKVAKNITATIMTVIGINSV